MITQWNLAVAKFATKSSRYSLSAINIYPDKTVATDGHVLVIVMRPEKDATQTEPKLIDVDSLNAVPVLRMGADGLHSEKKIKLAEGQFPRWEALFTGEKPIGEITFNAELLANLLNLAIKYIPSRLKPIRFQFFGAEKAMRIDCENGEQGMTALIMPLREDQKLTKIYNGNTK